MRNLLTLLALGGLALLLLRPLLSEPAVRAGTAIRMETEDLVAGSALIVEGRVQSAESVETEGGLVETIYHLAVDRTLLGDDVFARTVRLPGGVLEDGRGMLLSGVPHLREGEDTLLFLSPESARGVRLPVGLAQGRYRILTRLDGSKLAVRDQGDLGLIDPRSGELLEADGRHVRDYAELLAEIEAAVALVRSRPEAPR